MYTGTYKCFLAYVAYFCKWSPSAMMAYTVSKMQIKRCFASNLNVSIAWFYCIPHAKQSSICISAIICRDSSANYSRNTMLTVWVAYSLLTTMLKKKQQQKNSILWTTRTGNAEDLTSTDSKKHSTALAWANIITQYTSLVITWNLKYIKPYSLYHL